MASQTTTVLVDNATANNLRSAASHAAENAYAPYSHFRVGAALLLNNGAIITGCNVENASYRLTNCAEQNAVGRAITEHGPTARIVAVAVANADPTVACQPCGACRQTLAEFADATCPVLYPGDKGQPGECTLGDLLPASFTAASLDKKHA